MTVYLAVSLVWALFATFIVCKYAKPTALDVIVCFVVNLVCMPLAIVIVLMKIREHGKFPLPSCKIRK